MDKLMVLGASISQAPTYKWAKIKGVYTVGVDGSPDAKFKNEADEFHVVDIKDKEAILNLAKSVGINGIIVPGTDFSTVGSYVAEKLGLPAVSNEIAEICTDKFKMRNFLMNHSFLTPRFLKFDKNIFSDKYGDLKEDYLELCRKDLVVKPIDSMAARGAKRVNNDLSEISDAVTEALRYSRSGEVIVEEYIPGMELSIEALVVDREIYICGVADRHFSLDPYFIEIGHTMPSILDEETQKYAVDEFKRAIREIGFVNGVAKGDVKITEYGVMICEIAARLSGGYFSGWSFPAVYGYCTHDGAIDLALGIKPSIPKYFESFDKFVAERVFLSIPGKVDNILGFYDDAVIEMQYYKHYGDELFFPYDNAKRNGSVITLAINRDNAIKISHKGFIKCLYIN